MAIMTTLEIAHDGRTYRCDITPTTPSGETFIAQWSVAGVRVHALYVPERIRLSVANLVGEFNYRHFGK